MSNYPSFSTTNPYPSAVPPMSYTTTNMQTAPSYLFATYQAQTGVGAQPLAYSNPCATNYPSMEFQSSEQLMATALPSQNTQYNNFAGYQVQSVVPNPYSAAPYYNPYQAPAPYYPQYPAPVQTNYYPQYPAPSIAYNDQNNPFVTQSYAPSAPTMVIVDEVVVQNEEPDHQLIELKSDNLELQNRLVAYRLEIDAIKTTISSAEETAAVLMPNNSGNSSIDLEGHAIKINNLYQQLEKAKENAEECELLIQFSDIKLADYKQS